MITALVSIAIVTTALNVYLAVATWLDTDEDEDTAEVV